MKCDVSKVWFHIWLARKLYLLYINHINHNKPRVSNYKRIMRNVISLDYNFSDNARVKPITVRHVSLPKKEKS